MVGTGACQPCWSAQRHFSSEKSPSLLFLVKYISKHTTILETVVTITMPPKARCQSQAQTAQLSTEQPRPHPLAASTQWPPFQLLSLALEPFRTREPMRCHAEAAFHLSEAAARRPNEVNARCEPLFTNGCMVNAGA